MKRILGILFLSFFAIQFSAWGSSGLTQNGDVALAAKQVAPTAPVYTPSYYGFYDSQTGGNFNDQTQAISSYVNTSWLRCDDPFDCVARLQEAKYFNMHAMVALAGPGVGFSDPQFDLMWAAKWAKLVPALTPYVVDGTIAAFYPWDEPYGSTAYPDTTDADTTMAGLNSIAATIKSSFPSAKIAMVFTGALNFSFFEHNVNIIPKNFDWVGIDIYGCYSNCSGHNIPWYIQTLEAFLYPGQKIMVLPATAGFYAPPCNDRLTDKNWPGFVQSYASQLESYLNYVQTDPHIVAVFGFIYGLYGPLSGGSCWVGASDSTMGPVLAIAQEFGTNVMKRHFSPPPSATGAIVEGKPVELVNFNSQKCLDVIGAGTTAGEVFPAIGGMQQWDCLGNNQLNQLWQLYSLGSGQYQIISENYMTTRCLDLKNGSTTNGSPVDQSDCDTTGTNKDQIWNLVPTGGGYEIVSASNGKCLDVSQESSADGAQVWTWDCLGSGQLNQIWTVDAARFQMSGDQSNNVLAGWPATSAIDNNFYTSYSSKSFPSSKNNDGTFLAAWLLKAQTVTQIKLGARMLNGVPLAFPLTYDIYLTSPNNSKWDYVGSYSDQPDASGIVVIGIPASVTEGIMIVPTTLGVDNYGTHYFQLNELQLLGNGIAE